MLEELGLGEAVGAGRGRRARLQHLHDPREARSALRRPPRAGARAEGAPRRHGDRRRRLLRGGTARAALRALPVRRRRLRAGHDPAPGRVARRGRRERRARFVRHRRGAQLRRHAPDAPRAPLPGLGAGLDGLQLEVRVLHRPERPRPRGQPPARARSSPRSTRLAAEGVREITLLGQNVNSLGPRPGAGRSAPTSASSCAPCDAVDGIERIRFTSPHPKDFREPVIAALAECDAVCEHVHLPLQSGSTRLLKAMRRTYDRDRYLRLVEPPPRGRSPTSRSARTSSSASPARPSRTSRRRSRSSRRSATTAPSRSSSRPGRERRRRRCPTRCPRTSSASGSSA